MFRPYILAILRELQVWLTRTVAVYAVHFDQTCNSLKMATIYG